MHTVFALLCFVVFIHWLIFPYPSGLLHWHCGNLTIAPVPAKQPWWIWINTSCEFIMSDCITTTKQSATKPCAYFLGYTVYWTTYFVHIVSSTSAKWILCSPVTHICIMTSSNGNIFRVTGQMCGEFTGHRWISGTKASDAELWCYFSFDMRLEKRLSKQWRGWWFDTPSCPLWRHCND